MDDRVSDHVTVPDRPTVLVADGDRDLRRYLTRLLGPHYDVIVAADGVDALRQARARAPDLVVTDVVLPRRGGLELLAALRADPDLATVPVILLSARTGGDAAVEGLDAGADDYLAKPFSGTELLARMRTRLAPARVGERDRLLREQTTVALTLQRSILGPIRLPDGFCVRYEPAAGTLEVGGDWYDVVELPGATFGVVVGDVVGRGLGAAAVMGQLRSAGRALLLEGHGPAQVLSTLDRFAALIDGARCSTVFCAVLDPHAGTVRYSSAGHLPAILVDRDGTHRHLVDALAVPLAVLDGVYRPQARTSLVEGSTLLLYTDGLVERRGQEIDVGIDRAVATVVAHRHRPVAEVVDALDGALIADGHDDDVAVLAYRHHPPRGCEPVVGGKVSRASARDGVVRRARERGGRTQGSGEGVREMGRDYEPVPASCALVRQDVNGFLSQLRLAEGTVQAALLVANELASNAVDHAGTPFRVAVSLIDDRLRIGITDGSRDLPVLRPRDPGALRGRGLQLVDQLASTWGCTLGPAGKTVAAEMSLALVGT